MNRKYYNIIGLLAIGVLISSCTSSSGNYTNLHHDRQVTQMFENLEVNPEYQYFYTGSESLPRTIVGISKKYNLSSKFWHPVDLTPKQLNKWIFGQSYRIIKNARLYGSNIIGPKNEFVGIYYSLEDWQQWARIEIVEPNVLKISSPVESQTRKRLSNR